MSFDTIFALSSGRPPAAVAVVRTSGPLAHVAARAIAGDLADPRITRLCTLRDPRTGRAIDRALVLRFDGPLSATGEDIVEYQCHGGRAVVDALCGVLASFEGMRAAEPGEFTRRALASGRIDLTEAEGLADLIEAETEVQRRSAMAMAGGALRLRIEDWQRTLLDLSAQAEAAIDYDDEDDVRVAVGPLLDRIATVAGEIDAMLRAPSAERLHDGVRVVFAGPVNAGKSSLFNRLVGEDRAIVTHIAGTTRDSVELPIAIGGIPLLLIDTAGHRETDDLVESIGIDRAHREIERADIILWLGSPADAPVGTRVIQLAPKADEDQPGRPGLAISARTGQGVDELVAMIVERSRALLPRDDDVAINRRQRAHLADAFDHLSGVSGWQLELIAERLRQARGAFQRLTGTAGVEDMLDALFSRFCVGK